MPRNDGGDPPHGETKICAWCFQRRAEEEFTADPYGWKLYGLGNESYYLTCHECVDSGIWAVGHDQSPWRCGLPTEPAPMIPEEDADRWTIVADKLTGGALLGADELISAIRGTEEIN